MEEKKMNMKYYIGILCAVTLVIGAMAGLSVSAADDADVNEITKTVSMEKLVEQMEAKGFVVTVEDDVINAYKEYKKEGYEKTVHMTIDCPGGECQFQKPQPTEGMDKCGMDKKHFKFRMHGTFDMEAVKAKMEAMGYDTEAINEKFAWMTGKEHKGFEGCPMRQEASE
ncbi:MAG: hypothetical protein V3U72_05080 [Candidatus Aenigmarchaeota archaeon]